MRKVFALLPKDMAMKGFRFILISETESCNDCELRKVCIESLEEERCYEVEEVRKKSFRCPVYGEMRVCRIKQVNEIFLSIPRADAIEGVTIRYNRPKCQEITCPNFDFCNPIGIKEGDEIEIVQVSKLEEPCKLGLDLVKCLVNIVI